MVNHINNNKNNNTVAIKNKNKTVSPITLNKITTNSPPSEEWSIQSDNKNKRNHSDSSNPTSPQTSGNKVHKKLFSSSNRFEVLSQTSILDNNPKVGPDVNLGTNSNHEDDQMDSLTIKPPPPIFVRGVEDFPKVCKCLDETIGVDNFVCKSSTDRLKIQTSTPDAYRSLIHFLRERKAEYHTYQLQQDKPIRVVIRNLHPTTPISFVKSELEFLEFEVRSVTNVLHKTNKYPLPLFFIDLEPVPHSNNIFKLSSLLHTKIKVEEPFKTKTISQCVNCQEYGHTRSYCGYPSRCVRCGAFHLSSDCSNPPGTSPKYALCQGSHPVSYKGCSEYKDLQRRKKPTSNFPFNNVRDKSRIVQDSHPSYRTHNHESTYAQATSVINNFTNLIQSPAWSSNSHTHHPLNQTSVPSDIRILIADKRRVRAFFQRNRLPSLKHNYNKLSNLLKKMLAKHKASVLEHFLTNLSPNDCSLWRATKRTYKFSSQNIPIKKSDGSFVCTDLDKAELFKDYLYETFQPHPHIFSLENNIVVAESLISPLPVSRPVKHFSPSEVKFVIDKYPHKKSPGFDLITGEVARCLPKKAIIHLTHIFNCILRLSYFPILWKFSTIIMIPKPKKPPDSVSSFRPISLLPFFAKILKN
ncbi:hypothetical protein QTP88_020935 [Uroleucon formosanum]